MTQQRYKLDNSAIIHLASMRKGHSNTFRISAALHKPVDPALLRQALEALAPRFPTMVAAIRPGMFHYYVVPAERLPAVEPDNGLLHPMTAADLRRCAMRVYYRDQVLAVETFHAITDGFGGFAFFNALLAEYLRRSDGVDSSQDPGIISPASAVLPSETEDSFVTHGGCREKAPFSSGASYQLPAGALTDPVYDGEITMDAASALEAAHRFGVSLTELVAAAIAQAALDVQQAQHEQQTRPVRLMVPADLRRMFPSRTLRNFSLYAMPSVRPEAGRKFETLLRDVSSQLRRQLTPEALGAKISTNLMLDKYLFWVPLQLKMAALRLGFSMLGERTSTLTVSNMGRIRVPESLRPHIVRIDAFLTPRICSGYNCVLMTLEDRLVLSFTRRNRPPVLETCLVQRLRELGLEPGWDPEKQRVPC